MRAINLVEARSEKVEHLTRPAPDGAGKSAWLRMLPAYSPLRTFVSELGSLNRTLSVGYEPVSESEMADVLAGLRRVQTRLILLQKNILSLDLSSTWPYKQLVNRLDEERSRLESNIEGFELSLDPDFRDMLVETVADVKQSAPEPSDCHLAQ